MAKLARAFGMDVIYHSVSGRKDFTGERLVNIDELLSLSDVVSIHCPLTDNTEGLINRDKLQLMQKHALLINTARGSIVDFSALLAVLENKGIAGAGIDVAPEEPPKKDDPIMKLNTLDNCIVTPHSAWASQQSQTILMQEVIKNIEAAADGKARNLVSE